MYSNILLPIAFDDDVDFDTPLTVARTLLDDGGKVTLLHVFDTPPAYAMSYIPADLVKAQHEGALAELQEAARAVPGGRAVVRDGPPGRTITDFARDEKVDLIVMASHRPDMGDFVWGSTASFVVRHVGCAVHVLR